MKWVIITMLLAAVAAAECIEPTDGMVITDNILFCSSTYDVPGGITIAASGITVDCGTGILRGIVGESEIGIRIENADQVTLKNCNIITFTQGLYLKNVTNSLVEKNSFLKNRIGVRMLDSFENILRDNNDKSHQVAVSAINSKFNVVMLGNKEIERSFCEVNACNEYRDMNVCESGDFYCSKKCTSKTDADCIALEIQPAPELKEPEKTVEEKIEEFEEEVKKELKPAETVTEIIIEKELPLKTKILIYVAIYIIGLAAIQIIKRKKR
jgi:parallel beta-helix repeat protein